jgi:hypothetical protein
MVAMGAILAVSVSWAAEPEYSISPLLGLTDAEHTNSSDGKWQTTVLDLSAAGHVVGESRLYFSSGGGRKGQSVWLFDGSTTVNIGLTDAEHRRPFTEERTSFAWGINAAGQVIGTSERWPNNANPPIGYSAWLYDGSNTINIGLTDSEHTSSIDGTRSSLFTGGATRNESPQWIYLSDTNYNSRFSLESDYINDAGQVIGLALRFDAAGGGLGWSAWLYNGTTTQKIGFIDTEHTRSTDGYRYSKAEAVNEAGQVIGTSSRFDAAGNAIGATAWLYDGSLQNIGLTDADHTNSDGSRASSVFAINDSGEVVGRSTRYDGGVVAGVSTWIHDGTDLQIIHDQSPEEMNEAGQVRGKGWLYDGTTVISTGLTDSDHLNNSGNQEILTDSEILGEGGQVAGASSRYGNCTVCSDVYCDTFRTTVGFSAWLQDGSTAADISPAGSGSGHLPWFINDAGQVAGISWNFSCEYGGGWDEEYVTAWLYDGTQTILLDDLSSRSTVTYLGDDGTVLGIYRVSGEAYAYVYTPEDGMRDLELLIDDSFTAEDWARLATALEGNAAGMIIGQGYDATTGSPMGYLATPLQEPTPVSIDVLPGDAANQVYPNKTGRLPVAILGSAEFDATQVDPATLRFGVAQATIAEPVTISNVDGLHGDDTVARFNVAETGILCNDTEVTLTGATYAGEPIAGTDTIDATQCETGGCHEY